MKQKYTPYTPSQHTLRWLSSAAIALALMACGPDNNTTTETDNTTPLPPATKKPTKVPPLGFALHPRTGNTTAPRDILDHENASLIRHKHHALESRGHHGPHAEAAHTGKQELVPASPGKPVRYYLIGNQGVGEHDLLYLDKPASFTAMILNHVDLELRKNAKLDVGVMDLQSGTLTIQPDAALNVNGLYIHEGAKLTGGKQLNLDANITPGQAEILSITDEKPTPLEWFKTKEQVRLGGHLDEYFDSTASLVPVGKNARLDKYTGNGALHLRTGAKLTIGEINVTSAGSNPMWKVDWNSTDATELLQITKVTAMTKPINIDVRQVSSDIAVNDKLTVVTFPTNNKLKFKYANGGDEPTQATFGGKFKLLPAAQKLEIQLTEKGVAPTTQAKLSLGATRLSNAIMRRPSCARGRLLPLNIDAAVNTLNTLADTNTWFHHTGLPNVMAAYEQHTPGTWASTPNAHQSVVGWTSLDGAQVALSSHTPKHTAFTAAAHASYRGAYLDLIHQTSHMGANVGWMKHGFTAGVSYDYATTEGTHFTALGPVSLVDAQLHRTAAYVGFTKSIDQLNAAPIQISARLSLDIHRLFPRHTYWIQQANFQVNSQELDQGVGVELNLNIPVKSGVLSFNHNGHAVNRHVKQSVAFNLEIHD